MFFIYLSLFFIVFCGIRFTKFKEANHFAYIFLGFTSILFLFNDFKDIVSLDFISNTKFIIPILIIHSIYLLINNELKKSELCSEFHVLFFIAISLNLQFLLTTCLLGILTSKEITINDNRLILKRNTIWLILIAALSQMSWPINDYIGVLYIIILFINLFKINKALEVYSFGLTFAIIPFENTIFKIISFILLMLNSTYFLISQNHYQIIKTKLMKIALLEKITTIIKIKYPYLTFELKKQGNVNKGLMANKKDYRGLNFDYELFLLLIIFMFMAAL